MIRSSHHIAALVPVFRRMAAADLLGDRSVLARTLERLGRCERLDSITVLAEEGAALPAIPSGVAVRRVTKLEDALHGARMSARKWSPTAWRGGIGGATCHDEVLAAGAMVEAMEALGATAALIVGGDWPLVDARLCDAVIERHLSLPENLKLVFTQAPPGLCGCLITRELLTELRDKQAMIGSILDYQPLMPQGDPIGKDTCVQIEAGVRNSTGRFIYDAPRWRELLKRLPLDGAAEEIAGKAGPLLASVYDAGPQQATVELTTRRSARGLLTPAVVERPDLTLDAARRVFERLAEQPDTAVTFGGLGDPLLHPEWPAMIEAARAAGIAGVHVQTDLLVDEDVLRRLLESPVDVVSVHVNADTAATYQQVMGVDGLGRVIANLEWLLNHRREAGRPGLPWIVPRFAKTAANVHELETFFDRWVYYCGHAIVESPMTGCGAAADLAVMDMSPPRRRACRQILHRLSVHADGGIALCDQDWRGTLGDDAGQAWRRIRTIRQAQEAGVIEEPCTRCREWHRP